MVLWLCGCGGGAVVFSFVRRLPLLSLTTVSCSSLLKNCKDRLEDGEGREGAPFSVDETT